MLMLFVSLLAIAAGALVPSIAFRVRRDREEEMIHRGVQYSRAIRRYVKKTGRYPTRIEELENTNNLRFLRKRYKDPITGGDFKLLHIGDVQMAGAAGMPGLAGATPIGGNQAPGGSSPGATASAMLGSAMAQAAGAAAAAAPSPSSSLSATDNSGQDGSMAGAMAPEKPKADESQSGGISSNKLSSTVFGGGPIVGVASTSKAKSIREFNHKDHYNQWQFIYDPAMDRGGLITTPAQPALQGAVPLQPQNSSGQNSSGTSGFSSTPQSPPPMQPTQQPQ